MSSDKAAHSSDDPGAREGADEAYSQGGSCREKAATALLNIDAT
jgi:hypothetical protein